MTNTNLPYKNIQSSVKAKLMFLECQAGYSDLFTFRSGGMTPALVAVVV
jgi:hypothetical protein